MINHKNHKRHRNPFCNYFCIVFFNTALIAVCVPLGILAVLVSATADAIFKAYLYSYATGKTLPDNADTRAMRDAFTSR